MFMNQNWLVRSNVHWNESLGYRHQLERFENAISVFFPFYDSWGRCLPLRTRSSCQNRIIESKKVISQSPRSFLPRYSARSADKKGLWSEANFSCAQQKVASDTKALVTSTAALVRGLVMARKHWTWWTCTDLEWNRGALHSTFRYCARGTKGVN